MNSIPPQRPNFEMVSRSEISGIDPCCGKQVDAQTESYMSKYGPKTFYFCSQECKHTFDKDVIAFPRAYMISGSHLPRKVQRRNLWRYLKADGLKSIALLCSIIASFLLELDLLWVGIIFALLGVIFAKELIKTLKSNLIAFVGIVLALGSILLFNFDLNILGFIALGIALLIFIVQKFQEWVEKLKNFFSKKKETSP